MECPIGPELPDPRFSRRGSGAGRGGTPARSRRECCQSPIRRKGTGTRDRLARQAGDRLALCVGAGVRRRCCAVVSVAGGVASSPDRTFRSRGRCRGLVGGARPGVLAAFLSALVFPQLVVVTGSLSTNYPLLGGFFDLPRFVSLGLTGAAVGWGTSSYRCAQAALRERERLLTKTRDELETAVAERTAHLSASQEALRESQQRYERVMLASNAGTWDWDVTTDRVLRLAAAPRAVRFGARHDVFHPRGVHPEPADSTLMTARNGSKR